MSKVVYILGAGFSKCTDAPLQNEILSRIFHLVPQNNSSKFEKARNRLKSFLHSIYSSSSTEELSKLDLETLFTIIDRSLLNGEGLLIYSAEKIANIRRDLNTCIVYMFDQVLRDSITPFYLNLAEKIVEYRTNVNQKDDPFSFITLNWDIILDHSVQNACRSYNTRISKESNESTTLKKLCHIDYCCYTTPYKMTGYYHHGIDIKAKGHYNIKIQKLHGSLNWLICSDCGRLFFNLDKKIAMYELLGSNHCDFCGENKLRSFLISPTMIKDLNNTHLKMIWHNALLDLREAERVVFIGYSFPLADFELRYLLKRGINKNASIDVVLKSSPRDREAFDRFKLFFGDQITSGLNTSGTEGFFSNEFNFDSKIDKQISNY